MKKFDGYNYLIINNKMDKYLQNVVYSIHQLPASIQGKAFSPETNAIVDIYKKTKKLNDYIKDYYYLEQVPTKSNIMIKARIGTLNAKNAPPGLVRNMMCVILSILIEKKKLNRNDFIC